MVLTRSRRNRNNNAIAESEDNQEEDPPLVGSLEEALANLPDTSEGEEDSELDTTIDNNSYVESSGEEEERDSQADDAEVVVVQPGNRDRINDVLESEDYIALFPGGLGTWIALKRNHIPTNVFLQLVLDSMGWHVGRPNCNRLRGRDILDELGCIFEGYTLKYVKGMDQEPNSEVEVLSENELFTYKGRPGPLVNYIERHSSLRIDNGLTQYDRSQIHLDELEADVYQEVSDALKYGYGNNSDQDSEGEAAAPPGSPAESNGGGSFNLDQDDDEEEEEPEEEEVVDAPLRTPPNSPRNSENSGDVTPPNQEGGDFNLESPRNRNSEDGGFGGGDHNDYMFNDLDNGNPPMENEEENEEENEVPAANNINNNPNNNSLNEPEQGTPVEGGVVNGNNNGTNQDPWAVLDINKPCANEVTARLCIGNTLDIPQGLSRDDPFFRERLLAGLLDGDDNNETGDDEDDIYDDDDGDDAEDSTTEIEKMQARVQQIDSWYRLDDDESLPHSATEETKGGSEDEEKTVGGNDERNENQNSNSNQVLQPRREETAGGGSDDDNRNERNGPRGEGGRDGSGLPQCINQQDQKLINLNITRLNEKEEEASKSTETEAEVTKLKDQVNSLEDENADLKDQLDRTSDELEVANNKRVENVLRKTIEELMTEKGELKKEKESLKTQVSLKDVELENAVDREKILRKGLDKFQIRRSLSPRRSR